MEVAKDERPGTFEDRREGFAPDPLVGALMIGAGRGSADRGQVPLDQQRGLFEQRVRVVVGEAGGDRQERGSAVQIHQKIDGEGVKRRLRRARARPGQHPVEGVVAQVLEQHEPGVGVVGIDPRRAESEGGQVPRDRQERARVLVGRRRVHQHRRSPGALETLVAAERGVAGERRAPCLFPAGTTKERLDALVSGGAGLGVSQFPPPATGPTSRRGR